MSDAPRDVNIGGPAARRMPRPSAPGECRPDRVRRRRRPGDPARELPPRRSRVRPLLAIRTRPGTVIDQASRNVAFEIDAIDERKHEGWSVLVRGELLRANPTSDDFVEQYDPQPWLPDRDRWLLIDPWSISGRKLRGTDRCGRFTRAISCSGPDSVPPEVCTRFGSLRPALTAGRSAKYTGGITADRPCRSVAVPLPRRCRRRRRQRRKSRRAVPGRLPCAARVRRRRARRLSRRHGGGSGARRARATRARPRCRCRRPRSRRSRPGCGTSCRPQVFRRRSPSAFMHAYHQLDPVSAWRCVRRRRPRTPPTRRPRE